MNFKIRPRGQKEKRWLCLYAIKRQYSTGKEGVETDHLPGMRRSVLGNAAASEYQTVRSNIKDTLYILRNKERSKLRWIKPVQPVSTMITASVTARAF